LNRGEHLFDLKGVESDLVAEYSGLRGDDIDIRVDSRVVSLHLQIQELLG
jgi:hypothetical protein